MSPAQRQLELGESPAAPSARREALGDLSRGGLGGLWSLVRATVSAAPVWAPAVVAMQFASQGLVPTWLDQRRLDAQTLEVDTRVERLKAERAEIESHLAMLADPVYRERVRQSLRRPDAAPLRLPR